MTLLSVFMLLHQVGGIENFMLGMGGTLVALKYTDKLLKYVCSPSRLNNYST